VFGRRRMVVGEREDEGAGMWEGWKGRVSMIPQLD
jgi:hypothetical protein